MNRLKWQIVLGVLLVAISVILYDVQINLFHAERDTFFYLFQDLAFIPIQVLLIFEWLAYMKHLKKDYPYLFSFAVRTNPFDPNASPTIQ